MIALSHQYAVDCTEGTVIYYTANTSGSAIDTATTRMPVPEYWTNQTEQKQPEQPRGPAIEDPQETPDPPREAETLMEHVPADNQQGYRATRYRNRRPRQSRARSPPLPRLDHQAGRRQRRQST